MLKFFIGLIFLGFVFCAVLDAQEYENIKNIELFVYDNNRAFIQLECDSVDVPVLFKPEPLIVELPIVVEKNDK